MGSLKKTTRTTYLPGSPGVPADPGQPFLPARWVQDTSYVCSYGIMKGSLLSSDLFRSVGGYTGGAIVFGPPVVYGETCGIQTVARWAEAEPERAPVAGEPTTPAQTIVDKLLGWNARAHSKAIFPNYGKVRFTVPRSAIGVIAGLNDVPANSGYADIRFAFYLSHGIARILQSGVEVHNAGAFADGAVFSVRRFKGKIFYEIDGVEVYSSLNTDAPLMLDAALYSGGDTVDNPEIMAWSGGDGILPALMALPSSGARVLLPAFRLLGGTAIISGGDTVLPTLIGAAREGSRAYGALPALTGESHTGSGSVTFLPLLAGSAASYNYTSGASELPVITGSSQGGLLTPSYNISEGIVLFFSGSSSGLTGEIGGSNKVLPALDGLSSEGAYGESALALPAIVGFSSALEGSGNGTVFSIAAVEATLGVSTELYVTMTSEGAVSSVFAVGLVIPADMVSHAQALSVSTLQAVLGSVMNSVAAGGSLPTLSGEAKTVWVVNADTKASSRYDNYGFNSFAKIGGKYYGAKSGGIYQLDGANDNGIAVQAMAAFGKQDFGVSERKSVPNCYLGTSSAGKLYLKVIVEGQAYTYAARAFDENLKVQRFDLGKGIRANYIEFELYNQGGSDFELMSVEFTPVALSRRI